MVLASRVGEQVKNKCVEVNKIKLKKKKNYNLRNFVKQLCKWINTQSVIKSVNLNKYKSWYNPQKSVEKKKTNKIESLLSILIKSAKKKKRIAAAD